jgi:hypothetical protein
MPGPTSKPINNILPVDDACQESMVVLVYNSVSKHDESSPHKIVVSDNLIDQGWLFDLFGLW